MDIYSFLRSKDVAEHCRAISKKWNTYEMAVIIGRSGRSTIEKHIAWKDLIDNFPDMPLPEPTGLSFFNAESLYENPEKQKSIIEILKGQIKYDENILDLFMKLESNAFYKITAQEGEEYSSKKYSSYEDAIFASRDIENKDKDQDQNICIKKIIFETEDEWMTISAELDCDRNIVSWHHYFFYNSKTNEKLLPYYEEGKISDFLYDSFTYVEIPTPFKRGDILTSRHADVFVLDSYDGDEPETLARGLSKGGPYNYETEGWGYFVNDNGCLYGDHACQIDFYEYYRGKLEGNNRLLHYVSLF